MTFYMFKGIAAKLFISTHLVTNLVFPTPIEKVIAGWNKGEVFKYKSKDRKVLVLRANKSINSNFTVITEGAIYDFIIASSDSNPHAGTIEIKPGRPSTSFRFLKEGKLYKAYEGEYTVLILPKTEINVNGILRKDKFILPKGSPIFMNDKREIY